MKKENEMIPELEEALGSLFAHLVENEKPLDPEAQQILNNNLWDLVDDNEELPSKNTN